MSKIREYFCGIDIGTSGCKTVLIDKKGRVAVRFFKPYPLYTPKPGYAEQNPENWWKAVLFCLKKASDFSSRSRAEIRGIGLSGQMHGPVLLDNKGRVLRPVILWCDNRTTKEAEYIHRRIGKEDLFKITGNPAFAGFTASKILWVKRNEPEIYKQIDRVLLPKDYIRYRLTGVLATEPSDASGTSLFDITKRKWSEKILKKLGISPSLMPRVIGSTEIAGEVRKEAVQSVLSFSGIPVISGAADSVAQAVGSGVA